MRFLLNTYICIFFLPLAFYISHNRHNDYRNSINFLKSSIKVVLERHFEELLLKCVCLSQSSNEDVIYNVSIEEAVYLCARGVRRDIARDVACMLNPLKHNFPISEHEPEMFSFHPLITENEIILKMNIHLNRCPLL